MDNPTYDLASPGVTIGALVAERPAYARLFEELRLDYCCGGGQTLAEACAARGLDLGEVRAALRDLDDVATGEDPESIDWREASIRELCDHIVNVHHRGMRASFPRIEELLNTVVRVHGVADPHLYGAQRLFADMRAELEPHLASEERELFPACVAWGDIGTPVEERLISDHEHEHTLVGATLAALRLLCHDYDREAALCNTHRALLDALEAFERDLHRHVHEENNILLRRVRGLPISGA